MDGTDVSGEVDLVYYAARDVRQAEDELLELQRRRDDEIRDAHAAGVSIRRLARVAGLSPTRIAQIVGAQTEDV